MSAKEAVKKHGTLITGIAALLTALAALIPQVQPQLVELIAARTEKTKAETEAIRKAQAAATIAARAQVNFDDLMKNYKQVVGGQADALQDAYEARILLETRLTKLEQRFRGYRAPEPREQGPEQPPQAKLERLADELKADFAKKNDPRIQKMVQAAYAEEGVELELEAAK